MEIWDNEAFPIKGKAKSKWVDVDFPDVILQRARYFEEMADYHMTAADASKTEDIMKLPDSSDVIVILEGVSMYLTNA